jgi:hypothetical protein
MNKLIVESSAISTWHSLVTQACQVRSITLSEDIESYLVFLLMRFSNSSDLLNKIIATDFLSALHVTKSQQSGQLREVGDSCLLYSGFFPGMARRRRVSMEYYVHIGRQAYSQISAQQQFENSKNYALYSQLERDFVSLMDLLLAIRQMDKQSWLDPLQALETWQQTGSQQALITLEQHTSIKPSLWPSSYHNQNIKH